VLDVLFALEDWTRHHKILYGVLLALAWLAFAPVVDILRVTLTPGCPTVWLDIYQAFYQFCP
jgi:hypothetical protein